MVETVLTDAASYPSSVVIDAKSLVELSDRLNGWDTDAKKNSGKMKGGKGSYTYCSG